MDAGKAYILWNSHILKRDQREQMVHCLPSVSPYQVSQGFWVNLEIDGIQIHYTRTNILPIK